MYGAARGKDHIRAHGMDKPALRMLPETQDQTAEGSDMAKTEDLLDHSGEDECPVCRAFDLAYDVVIPALAAWENHYGLKEGQLGLATVLTAASALLEADLADSDGLKTALAEHLEETAAGLAKRPTAPGSESLQ